MLPINKFIRIENSSALVKKCLVYAHADRCGFCPNHDPPTACTYDSAIDPAQSKVSGGGKIFLTLPFLRIC